MSEWVVLKKQKSWANDKFLSKDLDYNELIDRDLTQEGGCTWFNDSRKREANLNSGAVEVQQPVFKLGSQPFL